MNDAKFKTVKDLIEELKKYDENAQLKLDYGGVITYVDEVTELEDGSIVIG